MQRGAAYALILATAVLLVIGIVMLQSTGAFARDSHGDMYFFVKRQGMWLVIGTAAMVFGALLDYRWWSKVWLGVYGLALLLLVLCFVPPVGMKINGAWRWVNLGAVSFQPSELGKMAVIFFLAWWYHRYERESGEFWLGFVAPLAAAGLIMSLIVIEVDLGATSLIGVTTLAVMFVAGTGLRWLLPLFGVGIAGLAFAIANIAERAGRLTAFTDPQKYRLDEGLQQWQALLAFGSGGVAGLGLGEGRQKMLYLPYAHTDFIFPMIGEELGLWFTLLTVFCFLVIMLSGVLISMNARDRFGMLLGFGATVIITLQASINIGVTTSLLPNKGMPLPFISYGGSNLAVSMFLVGILLNIHRLGRRLPVKRRENSIPVTSLSVKI